MLTNTDVPGTDEWWLTTLANALGAKFPAMQRLRLHYKGTPPVDDGVPMKSKNLFTSIRAMSRINLARIIVSAPMSRMIVTGLRSSDPGDELDEQLMKIWDDSHMRLALRDVLRDTGIYGSGFIQIDEHGMYRQDAWRCIVDPNSDPWDPDAAVVLGYNPVVKADLAYLYRNDGGVVTVRVATHPTSVSSIPLDGTSWTLGTSWDWVDEGRRLDWADKVPVIAFTAPGGEGQFEPFLDSLDRVNLEIYDRLIIMVYQAFRQRWIQGKVPLTYDEGPHKGEEIDWDEQLGIGPDAMLVLPGDVQLNETQSTDTTGITTSIKDDLQHISAVSGTPLYMLVPDAASGSANGADLARESLVNKIEELEASAADSINSAMRLALAAAGSPTEEKISPVWAPPSPVSLLDRSESANQLVQVLPKRSIWRYVLELTPEQMEQAAEDAAEDDFSMAATDTDTGGLNDGTTATEDSVLGEAGTDTGDLEQPAASGAAAATAGDLA